MWKKKKKREGWTTYHLVPELGPEPADAPLRLCQNPHTGMLYLNRAATDEELLEIQTRLLPPLRPD